MVKNHLEHFFYAICHRIANVRAEGLKTRIQWNEYTTCGFSKPTAFVR